VCPFNCSEENWLVAIEKNVRDALAAGQPVLVFGDYASSLRRDAQKTSDWSILKSLLNRIASDTSSGFQTMCSESDVLDNLAQAVLPNTITLSSIVAGRGVDFKPSLGVNKKGGLHVLVAFCPPDNPRLLIQMIGRTARLDANGSHSILLRGAMPKDDGSSLVIKDFTRDRHLISRHIVMRLCESAYNKSHWQRWVLLNMFMAESTSWPSDIQSLFRPMTGEEKGAYLWENLIAVVAPVVVPPADVPNELDLDADLDVSDSGNSVSLDRDPAIATAAPLDADSFAATAIEIEPDDDRDIEAADGRSLFVTDQMDQMRHRCFSLACLLLFCGGSSLAVYYLIIGRSPRVHVD
jgi:hypothetical protein